MLPSDFLSLDPYEKGFIMAAIDIKIEAEDNERKNIKGGR